MCMRLVNVILIGAMIVLPITPVWGEYTNAYQHYIRLAEDALAQGDLQNAYFYIENAHLAEPERAEPVQLLDRLPQYPDYARTQEYYYELALKALETRDYPTAIFYFKTAYNVNPSNTQALDYVNLCRRLAAGEDIDPLVVSEPKELFEPETLSEPELESSVSSPPVKDVSLPKRKATFFDDEPSITEVFTQDPDFVEVDTKGFSKNSDPQEYAPVKTRRFIQEDEVLDPSAYSRLGDTARVNLPDREVPVEEVTQGLSASPMAENSAASISSYTPSINPGEPTPVLSMQRIGIQSEDTPIEELVMNGALWAMQPNMQVEVPLKSSVILRSDTIKRWLIVTDGIFQVQRLDQQRIQLTAVKRGSTFIHIWDGRGRWTFNFTGILPVRPDQMTKEKLAAIRATYEEPFRFIYSNNWNASYLGESIPDMERRNLVFNQFVGIDGLTPYGILDAGVNFYKFEESTEMTGQTIGLTNGQIGNFKDFNIRVMDAAASFSPLSMPGRQFRGLYLDAFAFSRMLRYTYLHGQDRAQFLFNSSGAFDDRDSFIEAFKLTLFPSRAHEFSINFARGYGEDREVHLKDRVVTVQGKSRFKDFKIESEFGYDEDVGAAVIFSELQKDLYSLRVNFRNVNKDYRSITGSPAERGEVGGDIHYSWNPGKYRFNTSLNVYRDRDLENPDNPNGVNFDVSAVLGGTVKDLFFWESSAFYLETPQIIQPRESLRVRNSLNWTIPVVNNRNVSMYVSQTFQRNRFDMSPGSEFDRMALGAGLRIPIFRALSYYLNYEYSWVNEIETGLRTTPNVLNTGVNYYANFADNFSGTFNVAYRDEEQTEGSFSFLSGEDSLQGGIGLTYHPKPDLEIFFDGTLRNIWTENPEHPAFNEGDVRLGLRGTWDLFFRWNPSGFVEGFVYKDINGNKVKDDDEPGMPDVGILVGKKQVETNTEGFYRTKIKAKKAKVSLNVDTLPQGYVFTTEQTRELMINHGKTNIVNFGITNRTGIYGVVFRDRNGNQIPDAGDEFIPRVRIVLDKKHTATSNFQGVYRFDNIQPGSHTILVDVNSIPLPYLPKITVKSTIDVLEGATHTLHIPVQ